jgi:hypothetical protein
MRSIAILLITCFVCGCRSLPPIQGVNWTKLRGAGLPEQNETYGCLTFETDSIGYLGGSGWNEQHDATILYRTIDQGSSWTKLPLSIRDGSIQDIFPFGETLFAIYSWHRDRKAIIRSVDRGIHWTTIFSDTNHAWIRGVTFSSSRTMYIVWDKPKRVRDGGVFEKYVLRYDAQLSAWDTVALIANKFKGRFGIDTLHVYALLTDFQKPEAFSVLVAPLATGVGKEIKIGHPYFGMTFTLDTRGRLYVGVTDSSGRKGMINCIVPGEDSVRTLDFGEYSNYMCEQIHVNGDLIVVTAQRIGDAGPGPWGGYAHHLLLSRDGGKTWVLEEMPAGRLVTPSYLYKDSFMITATDVPGWFLKRKF